mmetsp:Transcript_30370/g.76112  ORF Transcript_30370/g.76112 Transcript_30370/m.76112 type:complete len:222 (+) Transcript_30370:1184-1849(+)
MGLSLTRTCPNSRRRRRRRTHRPADPRRRSGLRSAQSPSALVARLGTERARHAGHGDEGQLGARLAQRLPPLPPRAPHDGVAVHLARLGQRGGGWRGAGAGRPRLHPARALAPHPLELVLAEGAQPLVRGGEAPVGYGGGGGRARRGGGGGGDGGEGRARARQGGGGRGVCGGAGRLLLLLLRLLWGVQCPHREAAHAPFRLPRRQVWRAPLLALLWARGL